MFASDGDEKEGAWAEHPDTLTSMNNLGRAADAVELMKQCVQSSTKVLGAEHAYALFF